MCRRPSIATLFAYTTLFRYFDARDWAAERDHGAAELVPHGERRLLAGERMRLGADQVRAVRHLVQIGAAQDRKSTRLNSSHVKISYAVFCLKKKNSRIYRKD